MVEIKVGSQKKGKEVSLLCPWYDHVLSVLHLVQLHSSPTALSHNDPQFLQSGVNRRNRKYNLKANVTQKLQHYCRLCGCLGHVIPLMSIWQVFKASQTKSTIVPDAFCLIPLYLHFSLIQSMSSTYIPVNTRPVKLGMSAISFLWNIHKHFPD